MLECVFEPLRSNGRLHWLHYTSFQASCYNKFRELFIVVLTRTICTVCKDVDVMLSTICKGHIVVYYLLCLCFYVRKKDEW